MSEKIEVGYRKLGSLGYDYHHKFLLYTDKTGKQYTISGWTDEENVSPNLPLGNIRILAGIPVITQILLAGTQHKNNIVS